MKDHIGLEWSLTQWLASSQEKQTQALTDKNDTVRHWAQGLCDRPVFQGKAAQLVTTGRVILDDL